MKFMIAFLCLAIAVIAQDYVHPEFIVNYADYHESYKISAVTVRAYVEGKVAGFVTRAESALKDIAEIDNDSTAALYSTVLSDWCKLNDYSFRRPDYFDTSLSTSFLMGAETEYNELLYGEGKTGEEAYEIAAANLVKRQKKFVETVVNGEYTVYAEADKEFQPIFDKVIQIENYAKGTGPKYDFIPSLLFMDFNLAVNNLQNYYASLSSAYAFIPFEKV